MCIIIVVVVVVIIISSLQALGCGLKQVLFSALGHLPDSREGEGSSWGLLSLCIMAVMVALNSLGDRPLVGSYIPFDSRRAAAGDSQAELPPGVNPGG